MSESKHTPEEHERWQRIAAAAQAVTKGAEDIGDFLVSSSLMAALALALDEGYRGTAPDLAVEVERLRAELARLREHNEVLTEYFYARESLIATLGHPDATAADELMAETRAEKAAASVRGAIGLRAALAATEKP